MTRLKKTIAVTGNIGSGKTLVAKITKIRR